LFIDFSSAYDRVDRRILYNALEKRNVLDKPKLDLLKFIHKHMNVRIGSRSCHTTNGVPQGLTSSPACFDIVTESLLEDLASLDSNPIMYADDLVTIADSP
jgi:hypothetical protein